MKNPFQPNTDRWHIWEQEYGDKAAASQASEPQPQQPSRLADDGQGDLFATAMSEAVKSVNAQRGRSEENPAEKVGSSQDDVYAAALAAEVHKLNEQPKRQRTE